MHIAIFIYGLTGGGAPRSTLNVAKGLAIRKGHEVDLLMLKGGPLLPEVPEYIHLTRLSLGILERFVSMLNRRCQLFACQLPLAGYLRSNRPDVILSGATHANLSLIGARSLAYCKDIPLVLRVSNHLTGSLWKYGGPLKRFRYKTSQHLYPKADAIIAVSKEIADDLIHNLKIPSGLVEVIYNPIYSRELTDRAKEPVSHPWLCSPGIPVVLGAGRLSPQKDFATLIRAFALVQAKRPARLIILGKGKERSRLERLAATLGISKTVDLPGFVSNPLAWMARAAVLVVSSKWEGFVRVLVEAMAVGCPVVSTSCPSGPSEILEGGKYGPLVPVGDHEAMAEAILRTLSRPLPKQILEKRAKQFSVDQAVDGYNNVLEHVVKGQAAHH